MMKRNKAILCALVGIGFITSAGTVKANAMTMKNDTTTTKCINHELTVSQVDELLYKLPYTIDMNLGKQIETIKDIINARMAYNSLSKDDQKRLDQCAVSTLKQDERLLRKVLSDDIRALSMECVMNHLKKEIGFSYNTEGKIEIDENKVSSNKEHIINEMSYIEKTYNKLDYMTRYDSNLTKLMNDLNTIECKVAGIK